MPGQSSRFIASTAAAFVLLVSAPTDRAKAGHDIKEAYASYYKICTYLKGNKLQLQFAAALAEKEKQEFAEICNTPTYYLHKQCRESLNSIKKWHRSVEHHAREILRLERECREARSNYTTALSELLTQTLLTPPEPDPNAVVSTPPRSSRSSGNDKKIQTRKRRSTTKTTREPPRGHTPSQTQALAIIGGIIIQGVQKGSRSGTRKSHPSSRPGYIP